ncbi:MAG: MFS transporter [Desulfurococcus sp.]|uniref:MFS transporter n=1 Tax=Desulfurococcus sp. TaxID=51678 RepID=UPI00316876DA
MKKVLYVFYAASFMLGVVGGAYYTVSRDIVYKHVGLDYVFMSLLIASETVPGFFSVVGGMVGDVIGRRRMLLLGALSSIPLALIGFTSVEFIPLLILVYGVATSMAQPSIYGGLLHYTNSSGSAYSLMGVSNSLGWAVGGVLGGYMAEYLPYSTGMPLLGILAFTGYMFIYASYPGEVAYPGAGLRDVVEGVRRVWMLFTVSLLAFTGTRFFFSNYVLVVRSMLGDPVLFGLVVNTIPALTGALIWPLLGRASDKGNPSILTATAILEYALFIVLFLHISDPLVVAILWAFPIYPLLEQGLVISISRKLPGKLQSLASGVFTTSISVAGALILVLGGCFNNIAMIGYTSLFILFCSLGFLILGTSRRK